MRHGGMLMRLAGVCAVLGITLSVAGFCLGGRLTSMRVYWDNGGPRVEYRGMPTAFAESSPIPAVDQATYDYGDAVAEDERSDQVTQVQENGTDFSVPLEYVRKLKVECTGINSGSGKGAMACRIFAGDDWAIQSDGNAVFTSEVDEDDGEWEITVKQRGKEYSPGRLDITVPRDFVLEELELVVSTCTLSVGGIQCNNADITVGAGHISLDDFTCLNESSWEVGAGSVTVENGHMLGTAEIECGMGSVSMNLDRPESLGYEMESGMGSVTVDGAQYAGIAVAKTSGSRDAELYFDIECGMGSVEISFND